MLFHPEGVKCPCGEAILSKQKFHKMQKREAVGDYRCLVCSKVFNIFGGTIWAKSSYKCSIIIAVLRGFSQGVSTLHLSKELHLNYKNLLARRHQIQQIAFENRNTIALVDEVAEADEMFQNAGEKGTPHLDPEDPPRRRANKQRGKGTMENDRPPIVGFIGRETDQIRLEVCDNTQIKTIQPEVVRNTKKQATLNTDESSAYNQVIDWNKAHPTVCHGKKEWARDDDGDGIREVHTNTIEGFWTGLRNFLRPFRGIHKKNLYHYVAMHEWAHNIKVVTFDYLRSITIPGFTVKHT